MGEKRERDLFLAFSLLAPQDPSADLCEPVLGNPGPTTASTNTKYVLFILSLPCQTNIILSKFKKKKGSRPFIPRLTYLVLQEAEATADTTEYKLK